MKFSELRTLVSKNIIRHRKKAGLTQEELGEKSKLNYKFLQRIEQQKQNVTLKTLWRICRALKLHPRDLFQAIRK